MQWNRQVVCWLGIVAFTSAAARAADYATEVLSDSPLVYQRFEETSGTTAVNLGSLGATHNGTYGGGYTLGQTGAITGLAMNGAVRLDGSTGNVLLNSALNSSIFSDGSYTFEIWFNQPVAAQSQDILAGVNTVGAQHGVLLETASGGDNIRFLHRSPSGGGGGQNINPSAETYTAGDWHHLAAVVDAGIMNLYIDGVLDANSGVVTSADINYNLDVVLGRIQPLNSTRDFNGLLDEFAVYDQALSADRVLAHFNNAASPVPEPGSVAVWSLLGVALAGYGWRRMRRASRHD